MSSCVSKLSKVGDVVALILMFVAGLMYAFGMTTGDYVNMVKVALVALSGLPGLLCIIGELLGGSKPHNTFITIMLYLAGGIVILRFFGTIFWPSARDREMENDILNIKIDVIRQYFALMAIRLLFVSGIGSTKAMKAIFITAFVASSAGIITIAATANKLYGVVIFTLAAYLVAGGALYKPDEEVAEGSKGETGAGEVTMSIILGTLMTAATIVVFASERVVDTSGTK